MCRDLRIEKGLKQREVASAIEIKPATYGNLESSRFKVIRRSKAEMLADFYCLDSERRRTLLDAWDRCPLSPYGEKQRESWARRNALRSKAKNHDGIRRALVDLLGIHLMALPDDQLCSCEFGSPTCPLCTALERLGLDPYTPADRDRLLSKLWRLQEQLSAQPADGTAAP